ncbi:MAG: HAD family hydrolase [Kiritimatiellaeota bacterium]|nr:HAD family hydrolase [Kiritimatiellota bacterium]
MQKHDEVAGDRAVAAVALDSSRLEALLEQMPSAHVGVIGDFCLDVYWVLDLSRSERSVETGKTTQPVREQHYSLGGAGNVVANLAALRVGAISVFGAVGDDPFGHRLLRLLEACGADRNGMQVATGPAWQTLTYCKPYVGDEELPRIDMGNFNDLPDRLADAVLEALSAALDGLDVVIVNQQVLTGIHTPRLRQRLRALIRRRTDKVFVFDGRHYTDSYPEAWLKVNGHEALRLSGTERDPAELVMRDEALTAGRRLHRRFGRPVFVTRGDRGCLVVLDSGVYQVPGLEVIGRVDPVGAGDSFLAGLGAALAAGAAPQEAAAVGNFTAGVTVRKLRQTGTATPEEVLEIGREPRYAFEPELAEDPRRARHLGGSDIEIVADPPDATRAQIAIFDHDGTISTLRQGWETVMENMMIRAILGNRYDDAEETLYHKVVDRVRTFIDQTTGIQTLSQMQGLVSMVREFGIVPREEILDEFGYKTIYNEALMQKVRDRLARLERGELEVADFAIKNAVEWLHILHRHGLRLYLASGTDLDDVKAEARAMGYADLFEDRIFGAVGDVTVEAKRVVLDRILAEIGEVAGRVVTFGDGPVEIRETRRRGGLPIGVASDEVRRFGLNPAKRTRLIRAGAVVIVPDFSQLTALKRFFGFT